MLKSRPIKIPFGKYKERKVADLPSNYLKWMIENIADEELQQAAYMEYRTRTYYTKHFYE